MRPTVKPRTFASDVAMMSCTYGSHSPFAISAALQPVYGLLYDCRLLSHASGPELGLPGRVVVDFARQASKWVFPEGPRIPRGPVSRPCRPESSQNAARRADFWPGCITELPKVAIDDPASNALNITMKQIPFVIIKHAMLRCWVLTSPLVSLVKALHRTR